MHEFREKKYVPLICLRMLKKTSLDELSVKQLKLLARTYGIDIAHCVEKWEILDLIASFELMRAYESECMGRFSLRIAFTDHERNVITKEELCSFRWGHRLRESGHGLINLVNSDPWHQGAGVATHVQFFENGKFEYYCDENSPLGFIRDHLDEIGVRMFNFLCDDSSGVQN